MESVESKEIITYIESFYGAQNEFLKALRDQAEGDKVPIISKEVELFLNTLLAVKKPKRILEIGTAVGYSALFFSSVLDEAEIVSIEISPKSHEIAKENVIAGGREGFITLLLGDALEVLETLEGPFDLIFIDAAKGQYKNYFQQSLRLLSKEGIIVSDNVLHKGMPVSDAYVTRRNRTIANRLRDYLTYISRVSNTSILNVGDGISLSVLNQTEKET